MIFDSWQQLGGYVWCSVRVCSAGPYRPIQARYDTTIVLEHFTHIIHIISVCIKM
jgi:hypothetical protein